MSLKNSPKGKSGETEAAKFLARHGYRIIDRNWIRQYAEIDIVAREGECLVFVEVKTRSSDEFGKPEEAMTPWKIKTLIRAAELYKSLNPDAPDQMRIDFVGVTYKNDKIVDINLIKNITG